MSQHDIRSGDYSQLRNRSYEVKRYSVNNANK